jgi:hypothetical protein
LILIHLSSAITVTARTILLQHRFVNQGTIFSA